MVNNGKGLSVDGIKEMRGGEYVLDGYITLANPKVFKDENGMEYSIQYYQKKHKNEYVIKSKKGDCCLYKNGLLKMIWKEDVDGNRMGEFVSFDKGRISFIQNFDNLLNGNEWIRMIMIREENVWKYGKEMCWCIEANIMMNLVEKEWEWYIMKKMVILNMKVFL